jgi:hypothetical protein
VEARGTPGHRARAARARPPVRGNCRIPPRKGKGLPSISFADGAPFF